MARRTIPRPACECCGQPARLGGRFCSHDCSNIGRTRPAKDRFWAKVEKTDTCWLWRGAIRNGYGRFNDGKIVNAHHYSWTLANGPVPNGLWVLHHCDTPRCVRPDHLFVGTHSENMRDMYCKGRDNHPGRSGEANHAALLRESDVREIRAARKTGETLKSIGDRYGVSMYTIFDIVRGRSWTHLK